MSKIIGKLVTLEPGAIEIIENTLSMEETLEKAFHYIFDKQNEENQKRRKMWRKYEKIAKEEFPEFDITKHILSWNWLSKTLSIHDKEDVKNGLLS